MMMNNSNNNKYKQRKNPDTGKKAKILRFQAMQQGLWCNGFWETSNALTLQCNKSNKCLK